MFFSNTAAVLLSILSFSLAQSSVPDDLSQDFDPSAITIQVLYANLEQVRQHGLEDGSTVSQQDVSKEPSFALGDSSGINTSSEMIITMVDTTSATQRQLHFLQTGFTASEDATGISSNDKAATAYVAPGKLGEPSGKRQYSWLVFQQPDNFSISMNSLVGKTFNVEDFMNQNNLENALAGIAMFVDISSSSSSSSQTGSSSEAVAASSTTQSFQSAAATTQVSNTVPTVTIAPASSAAASTDLLNTAIPPTFSFDTSAPTEAASTSVPPSSMTSAQNPEIVTSTTVVAPSSATRSSSSSLSSGAAVATGLASHGASFAALPVALAVCLMT